MEEMGLNEKLYFGAITKASLRSWDYYILLGIPSSMKYKTILQ